MFWVIVVVIAICDTVYLCWMVGCLVSVYGFVAYDSVWFWCLGVLVAALLGVSCGGC